jgi:uridine kinase
MIETAKTAPKLEPVLAKPKRTPFILGVAGGTGSGKTTVARSILQAVGH